ncbi:sugar transporter ERD6-like 6 [Maniola jurtina]|uniref:sugar transporter ERD6-like 6 n=1 Tax=Maniola jurtina TaxID=191418 RepID=UPI001E68EB51|nr:sugar transporter ERD6-like 6 [Maniola jurtina]
MFYKAVTILGLNAVSLSNGFLFGQVAGLISSLQKNEEGIDLSEGQISLIASIFIMVCLIGFGLAAYVTDKIGRRWPVIIFSVPIIIQWIILYFSYNMFFFMLSRIIAGISSGALIILTIFVSAEYTNPKTRAFYLNTITTVAPAIGTSLGHSIGIVLQWRTVALIGIIPAASAVLFPFFWVESPHWLASKGRFEECEIAFRQLHGDKLNSERELQMIIKMEKTKLKLANETSCKPTLKRLFAAFKRKYFWGLILMSVFMHAYLAAAGKLVFSTLATVILEEITGTSDVLMYTLLVDGLIIVGSCMSCYLIRKTSMRTLLFTTGFFANAVLVVLSACLYFKNGQNYFNWINVVLLALYFILINAGPYPLIEAIFSEMFPLELKVYTFSLSGVILVSSLFLTILLLPSMVSSMGYHGLFLLNASIMSISLGYIWFRLPETKGRTLQEIETYFKTNNFDVEEMLSTEQSKALM